MNGSDVATTIGQLRLRRLANPTGNVDDLRAQVQDTQGWVTETGTVTDHTGRSTPHTWNRLPDGSVLDLDRKAAGLPGPTVLLVPAAASGPYQPALNTQNTPAPSEPAPITERRLADAPTPEPEPSPERVPTVVPASHNEPPATPEPATRPNLVHIAAAPPEPPSAPPTEPGPTTPTTPEPANPTTDHLDNEDDPDEFTLVHWAAPDDNPTTNTPALTKQPPPTPTPAPAPPNPAKPRRLGRAVRVTAAAIVAVGLVTTATLTITTAANYTKFVTVPNEPDPAATPGSLLAATRTTGAHLKVGDKVVFYPPESSGVTHPVVRTVSSVNREANTVTTRHGPRIDPWIIRNEHTVFRTQITIPKIGTYLNNPTTQKAIFAIPVAAMIGLFIALRRPAAQPTTRRRHRIIPQPATR